ncbi:alpha/beta fold hydrolase [Umezawaea tangerina]|uniref:Alpha/beta hydrolase family protein n=1 Tax=Umezawaea tangerina TaxID=84725 RepID=A0A2T0TKW0_9PSEU|nr:hypothetical protein [Umezawaea tangerina]PRY46158.1 hypothetical protein CLV43_101428 [Umezawaea tangerina]
MAPTTIASAIPSLEALDRLGVRTDVYARIGVRTVLLGGDRSPARLTAWVDAIARVMPNAERVVLPGMDHGADLKHPEAVAGVVERLADDVLGG